MPMLLITFAYAAVMILFGALLYALAADKSLTAFIPGFVGIVVATLAAVGANMDIRKHMMHAVVALALLVAVVGIAMGLAQLGKEDIDILKVIGMLGMGAISGVYVAFAVRSFIAARRGSKEEV